MTLAMARLVQVMLGRTYVRFGLASAILFACDVCFFLLLMPTGLAPPIAVVIGYSAGMLMHWLISSRLVFTYSAEHSGKAAFQRKARFIASSLSGFGTTTARVALANMAGLLPITGKRVAIAISFQTIFSLRKMVVFA